jgi:drug/metabolite transporter (DMT)-like permease
VELRVGTERAPDAAALFATATVIWGSTWLGIKYQLGVVAPEVSVAYRFAAAATLLALWCMATRRSLRFDRRAHAFLAAQGALMFGLNYLGVYVAEQYATSGLVAVLFSTIAFMNPALMRFVYRTPLSPRTVVAATIGVAGVALLFLPDLSAARKGGNAALGVGYGLGATALASAGNIVALRNQRAGIPIFPGTAWAMLYGALAVAFIALLGGARWTLDARPAYWWSFAYLVVFGSIAAFGAYLNLMKKVGPGLAGFVGVATPVVALALSTLFEGYRWTFVAIAGAMLAVGGNLLALPNPPWRRPRQRPH